MKRLIRKRKLTESEVRKDDVIREQIAKEFPKEEVIRRKAFICEHCEGVYADEPVSQCDCMKGSGHDFIEGEIIYKKKS